ncbi:MAG: prolipoprotein diacylglyceryl transferase family protein [Chryseolinea sp.]
MDSLLIIDTENGGLYYSLLSFCAFLVGFIVLVLEGKKRKFPTLPWLLIVSTSFLLFVAGAQAIKFSDEDWQRVIQFKDLTHSVGRSMLGGILLAIPGLLLAKYFLKFRYNLMDSFAWAAPLSLFIMRIGCHLAGCCYGIPTSAPWGIQYGANSHAFNQHIHDHLIPATQRLSLIIHPIALYEATGCTVIMLLLFQVKRYIKVSGNLFLVSLGLYAFLRFFTEFFRANSFGPPGFGGLNIIQIILFILIFTIVTLILYRENKFSLRTSPSEKETTSIKQVLLYFLILLFSFIFISRWLSLMEVLIFIIVMIVIFLYLSWHTFKIITIPSMRLTTVILMMGSLIMMSQTLPEVSSSDTTKRAYNIFSMGALKGYSDFNINNVTYDCNGDIVNSEVSNVLHNSFNIKGAGYTRVEERGNGEVLQYGIDAYWGSHTETDRNQYNNISTAKTIPIQGIHPYIQYDWKLMGVGIGVHAGNMSLLTIPEDDGYTLVPTTVKKISVVPSAYFRIGYVNRVFGEIKIGQQFPAPFPASFFQTNIGIGFRRVKGAAIRIGTSSYAGLVIAPSLPLGKHFIFEPYVAGLPGLFKGKFNDQVDHVSSFVGSLSLRYKFGMNVKNRN